MSSIRGTSKYNSLQTPVNRRFSRGFQFGVVYTWSKTMDYGNTDRSGLPRYRPYRVWSYGEASFDQTPVFVFNYTWDLPKARRVWAFVSGTPFGVDISTTDNADITDGGDGVRPNLNYRENRQNPIFSHQPQLMARVDHRFSEKSFVYGRFIGVYWDIPGFESSPLVTEQFRRTRNLRSWLVSYTQTITPNLINEARWGLSSDHLPMAPTRPRSAANCAGDIRTICGKRPICLAARPLPIVIPITRTPTSCSAFPIQRLATFRPCR